MARMRTTTHNGRGKGSKGYGTKHNDRQFDTEAAENIDAEKTADNEYWQRYEGEELTFEQAELRYYEETFGDQLRETNEKYIKNGHPERCKEMAEWKQLRRNAPEESIFQIGKMEEHASQETLAACWGSYLGKLNAWNEEHGRPFEVLNWAKHVDEAVPHIQMRRVWQYQDAQGVTKVGQEKALEAAGVALPHPDKPEGRRNNRKMTFDAYARQLWIDTLKEHGLDIETEPVPDGRHNRSKEQMIRDKYEAALQETEKAKAEIKHLEGFIGDAKAEIEVLKEEKAAAEQDARATRQENEALRAEKVQLQEELNALQTPEAVRAVEATPAMFGGVKVSKEGWELVKEWADKGAIAVSYGDNMQEENRELREQLQQMAAEVERLKPRDPNYLPNIIKAKEEQQRRQQHADKAKELAAKEAELRAREQQILALQDLLREDLKVRMDTYKATKDAKKEAWAARSEAEANVAALESCLEDAGMIKGIIVRVALLGARKEATAAKQKHDALCAACRAQKHKIKAEQGQLLKQQAELDTVLQEGVNLALHPPKELKKVQTKSDDLTL